MVTAAAGTRPARAAQRSAGRRRMDATAVMAVVLLITHAILAWSGRRPGIATEQDDATYVILAESIRDGGYNELFRTEQPVHNMYPPAYPAILSVWGLPFGDAYDWLVLLSVLASTATLALAFITVRRVIDERIALLSLLPLALNPEMIHYAGAIASEAPYALFAMTALFLMSRENVVARTLGFATASAIVAALTRSAGITLVAAIWIWTLLERRWKAALWIAVASVLTVGVWMGWTVYSPEQYIGKSYVADLMAYRLSRYSFPEMLARRLYGNVMFYGTPGLPWVLSLPTIPDTPIDNAILGGVAVVGLVAGMVALRSRWRLALIYLLVYAALLSIWSWKMERFLVPVLPVMVPTLLLGLWTLGRRVHPAGGTVAALLFSVVLAAGATARTTELIAMRSICPRGTTRPAWSCLQVDQISYFNALDYITTHTAPDARILSFKPEAMYLYTGRRAIYGPRAIGVPPETFLEHLRTEGTDYILLGSLQLYEIGLLADRLEANCAALAVEQFFPIRTYLFRLRAAGEPPGEDGCNAMARFRAANVNRDFDSGI